MNLSSLSIKRPIFITCIVIVMLAVGTLSMLKLPVDLFPNVTFPVVLVSTPYPGAGPSEVETLVSKVFEDEMSTVPGIKTLRSINREGVSTVVAQFTLETDVKYAEQQIRDRVASAKRKLPADVKEPVIRRIDPADQPILIFAVTADLSEGRLFELADERIRPKIEQVNQVGLVEVIGGRKREIHVDLDRAKLKGREISASMVASRIAASGQNVPAGKISEAKSETVFRTLGEFKSLKAIESTIVSFLGSDVPVTISEVGTVRDALVDETSRTYNDGKKSLMIMVFRQSGSNTIAVADAVQARIAKLNQELQQVEGAPKIAMVRDGAKPIRANVQDVKESILFGILLTILVVFFFLANGRSTIITGLALPNSLIGAFILMAAAGFTVNIMTLLALSLSVGLLIDDAIVVRENIFRHIEEGESPAVAAVQGTREVTLAVIATTLTVIAVFGPIAFLQGMVGQFFKEFGLTICFAMAISLFDALTIAPMLSAYFASASQRGDQPRSLWGMTVGRLLDAFNAFQDWLEDRYEGVVRFSVRRPFVVLAASFMIFVSSCAVTRKVPKTFLPPQDIGEFQVVLDMPPGTSLGAMDEVAARVEGVMQRNPEISNIVRLVGGRDTEANTAQFFVYLVPAKQRRMNTSVFKERIREQLKPFGFANPKVQDINMVASGERPFNVNIVGSDLVELEKVAQAAFEKIKGHPALKDVDISHRPGKPEFQVVLDSRKGEALGISSTQLGMELRAQIEGALAGVYREQGKEYDIRVRLKEDQRDLRTGFPSTFVPNINSNLIRLADVASPRETTGPAAINRQDRGRYIQISAEMAPEGPGMAAAMTDIARIFETEVKLPPGMSYAFVGQAENFKELGQNMAIAAALGILFIYLVLASLYESFVTPFTIMLVLPLAAVGAFYALFITGESLNIFSMIGAIMLLGIATKNSILLVDYTHQLVEGGMERGAALVKAGRTRLRPILMTTVALIAGMIPLAVGLNEASRQRTSMGVAVIGGLISSTLLTLVVVPAAYGYIDRFRVWSSGIMRRVARVEAISENITNQ